jgi:hypothetical protein
MSDVTSLPTPYAAARIAAFLAKHLSWTAFWDKRAVSRDADTVIRYMAANS